MDTNLSIASEILSVVVPQFIAHSSVKKSPMPFTKDDRSIDLLANASNATIPNGSCVDGTITASAAINQSIFSCPYFAPT